MLKKSTTESMPSMIACLTKAKEDGYKEDLQITAEGLSVIHGEKNYTPPEVSIENFYRFEGASDPADNVILYIIKTQDGTKGTLLDSYGAYSDPLVNDFIQAVESISKKIPNENK